MDKTYKAPAGEEIVTQILPYIEETLKSADLKRLYLCIDTAFQEYAKQYSAIGFDAGYDRCRLDYGDVAYEVEPPNKDQFIDIVNSTIGKQAPESCNHIWQYIGIHHYTGEECYECTICKKYKHDL